MLAERVNPSAGKEANPAEHTSINRLAKLSRV